MKMKKIYQDLSSSMKNKINFDDVMSLAHLPALARMKISNKGKEIKKKDSSFERNNQFISAVQSMFPSMKIILQLL